MKQFALLLIALNAGVCLAQTNLIIPAPTCTAVVSCQGSTVTLPVATPPVITPAPVVTPPAAGMLWVYHNGTFNWPGDFSWNVSVNYKDTAGIAKGDTVSGPTDIAIKVIAANGGWQPYGMANPTAAPFDTSKYKYLQYCTKPTIDGQVFGTGFAANNDVGDGPNGVSIMAEVGRTGAATWNPAWGPLPKKGIWGCYKIPLSYFQLNNPLILKFSIADGSGLQTNVFYVDDVGFSQ